MNPLDIQNIPVTNTDLSGGSYPSSATARMDAADISAPHIVIRGESNNVNLIHNESLALIDWLSFTIYSDSNHKSLTYLEKYLENLFQIAPSQWVPAKAGWHGYKHRINFGSLGFVTTPFFEQIFIEFPQVLIAHKSWAVNH